MMENLQIGINLACWSFWIGMGFGLAYIVTQLISEAISMWRDR